MKELARVAFRNVGRNRRRALITAITVFLGVSVVMGARGLLNGLQGEFKSGLIRKIHGELQIHRKGYQDTLESNPYKMLLPYDSTTQAKIKSVPGVQEATPRLRVMALLNHQKTQSTTPVMVTALDSATEIRVCPRLKDALQSGQLLNSELERKAAAVKDENLEEATGLDQATPAEKIRPIGEAPRYSGFHQIMVTPGLMRGMQASLGDEVVVLLQDKDNMQQALVAKITGVIDFALPNSQSRMVWMDFRTLQDTLHLQGSASEIAIRTTTDDNLEALKGSVSRQLGDDQLVVETWLEIAGFFRDVMNLQNTIFSIVLLIVFMIVISAIINTSLMTVMERTREIGTLMALGYRRVHIVFMFLCESAVIGLAGGCAGALLISLALLSLSHRGLVFALPGQTVPVVLYPSVTPWFVAKVLVLALLAAMGASFWPAYRASRMKPVQALSAT